MASTKSEEQLFVPAKVTWMLSGGLETMDAGERQMLLIMAETKIQGGYTPTPPEQEVIEKLRALADGDYDAKDITKKVRKMVKGGKKKGTAPLHLPPMFDQLRQRIRRPKPKEKETPTDKGE